MKKRNVFVRSKRDSNCDAVIVGAPTGELGTPVGIAVGTHSGALERHQDWLCELRQTKWRVELTSIQRSGISTIEVVELHEVSCTVDAAEGEPDMSYWFPSANSDVVISEINWSGTCLSFNGHSYLGNENTSRKVSR